MEPVNILGILPMLQHILKRRKLLAAMVEHGVQHNSDPFFVTGRD